MDPVRLVYKDDKSHKFWEITVEGSAYTVRFGKVGTDGQTKTKNLDSGDEAIASAKKQIKAKEKKGYRREGGGKSIISRLDQIKAWLKKHQPSELELWEQPPATDEAIAAAEEALGLSLPEDYKEYLRIHNGQSDVATFVEAALIPVGEIAGKRLDLLSLVDEDNEDIDNEEVDDEVKPVYFSEGWVPIGCSARGRDFLCIDYDPTPKGTIGQIIVFVVDFDERSVVAKNFGDLLDEFLKQAEEGELEFRD